MISSDVSPEYYRLRESHELALAAQASNAIKRRKHLELAETYRRLAATADRHGL